MHSTPGASSMVCMQNERLVHGCLCLIGDIMYFSSLGKPTIVLNSAKAVTDLLDRRGSIYSDRPFLHMADMYVSLPFINSQPALMIRRAKWIDSLVFARHGSPQHGMRKVMSSYLSPRMISEQLHHVVEQETVRCLLKPLLDTPSDFILHIRKCVRISFTDALIPNSWISAIAASVLLIAYGREIALPGPDPMVKLAELVLEEFSVGISPGAYPVEFFPMCMFCQEVFSAMLIK